MIVRTFLGWKKKTFPVCVHLRRKVKSRPFWLVISLNVVLRLERRSFNQYGNVTQHTGENVQMSGSEWLRGFEQGSSFVVPHLLWHGPSVLQASSEGPFCLIALDDTQKVLRTYCYRIRTALGIEMQSDRSENMLYPFNVGHFMEENSTLFAVQLSSRSCKLKY